MNPIKSEQAGDNNEGKIIAKLLESIPLSGKKAQSVPSPVGIVTDGDNNNVAKLSEPEPKLLVSGKQVELDPSQGDAITAGGNNKINTLVKLTKSELVVKHPLQNAWTLWYLENDRTKSWEDMQNEVTTFDTVEAFWKLYNNIKAPSELRMGSDYSVFKKGIRPMWEDDGNRHGGRWIMSVNKDCRIDLDEVWLEILLFMIGEPIDHCDDICGAVVNIRNRKKISVWTANWKNERAINEIGDYMRDKMHLPENSLQYQKHTDTMIRMKKQKNI